jgi:cytidylate kinase
MMEEQTGDDHISCFRIHLSCVMKIRLERMNRRDTKDAEEGSKWEGRRA